MRSNFKLKVILLATVPAALLCLPAVRAVAQSAGDATDLSAGMAGTEIVVFGYRKTIEDSIASKREADTIADFMTSDDIGQQPDLNLADTYRRLPGVVTEFDEDEGRFVSIRGLPSRYTFVSMNGGYIPDGWFATSRTQNIESIPSSVVKKVAIYKALTPDLEGNAIGGYVENTLFSAFDEEGFSFKADVSGGYHTFTDTPGGEGNPSPKVEFRMSNNTGQDEGFGYVLSGSYFDKHRDQSKSLRRYGFEADGRPFINQIEALDYTNSITRWNALGRLEYKNEDVYTAVTGSRFDYQYDEYRYWTTVVGRGARTVGDNGDVVWSQGQANINLTTFPIGTTNDFLQWEGDWKVDPSNKLSGNVSFGRGKYELDHDANSIVFRTGNLNGLGFSTDSSQQDESADKLAGVTFKDASQLTNLANFNLDTGTSLQPRIDKQQQDVLQYKADYVFKPLDQELGFKIGGLTRNLEVTQDWERFSYRAIGGPINARPFFITNHHNDGLGHPVALLDPDKFVDFFNNNPTRFTKTSTAGDLLRNDLSYEETILAGYGMATVDTDWLKIRGGLRVEQTSFDTASYQRNSRTGVLSEIERSGDYVDVLPSVVASFKLSNELTLRAGASQSIGRPDPGQIAQAETTEQLSPTLFTVSQGNEDLSPRESNNVDLSLEYYAGKGIFFGVAGFHKDLKNEIFNKTENRTIDGIDYILTQPVNASGAIIKGVELSFTYDKFVFLPGFLANFGVNANATFIQSELDVEMNNRTMRSVGTLQGASDFFMNAALLYQDGPFEGKLTYSYVGDRRISTNTSRAAADVWELPYAQLDFKASYRLFDGVKVYLEGRNITENSRLIAEGEDKKRFQEVNDFGASYWLGTSMKF